MRDARWSWVISLLFLLVVFASCNKGGGTDPFADPQNPPTAPPPDDPPTQPPPNEPPTEPPTNDPPPTQPPTNDPPTQPPSNGDVTDSSVAPRNAQTPTGVTWHIGFPGNVTRQDMEDFADRLVQNNDHVWRIFQGQLYLYRARIYESVGRDVSNIDVYLGGSTPYGGYVQFGPGRSNRIMVIHPRVNVSLVFAHESGHLFFSFRNQRGYPSPTLDDEYRTGSARAAAGEPSSACKMLAGNQDQICDNQSHVDIPQDALDISCWQVILNNYENWRYPNTGYPTSPPARLQIEYFDN